MLVVLDKHYMHHFFAVHKSKLPYNNIGSKCGMYLRFEDLLECSAAL